MGVVLLICTKVTANVKTSVTVMDKMTVKLMNN